MASYVEVQRVDVVEDTRLCETSGQIRRIIISVNLIGNIESKAKSMRQGAPTSSLL